MDKFDKDEIAKLSDNSAHTHRYDNVDDYCLCITGTYLFTVPRDYYPKHNRQVIIEVWEDDE